MNAGIALSGTGHMSTPAELYFKSLVKETGGGGTLCSTDMVTLSE